MSLTTPIREDGIDAYYDGTQKDENPYSEGTLNYDEWLCGFLDAEEEDAPK